MKKSRRIVSFLTLLTSKIEEVKLSDRQVDRLVGRERERKRERDRYIIT